MTPFDVVLVPFPFADLSTTKKRPCLVLATFKARSLGLYATVAMITSNASALKFPHDVDIEDLSESGLPLPSVVRLAKVVTLEGALVIKKLGKLGMRDQKAVRSEFRKLFSELV